MILKLVSDDKIPYVSDFFGKYADIVFLPGEKITQHALVHADILLTRTVTEINAALLTDTAVQFVGTATTGVDHIDQSYLASHHIHFAHAAGANAEAVAQYVLSCLANLKQHNKLSHHHTIGIIGCGRIGYRVATLCENIGLQLVCYDPLINDQSRFVFTSLEMLLKSADIISLHTPLTRAGSHPTFHMIDANAIATMKDDAILINTARGAIIDETALLQAKNITLCFDVWENEPAISLATVDRATIATPHIAGYSTQAKYRATEMVFKQAADFFGWSDHSRKSSTMNLSPFETTTEWEKKILDAYDPLLHTMAFKNAIGRVRLNGEIENVFMRERKAYVFKEEV